KTPNPVLVKGLGVDDTGGVADSPVLELVGHPVLLRRQVAGPVAPQTGLARLRGPRAEGGGLDHGSTGRRYSPLVGGVRADPVSLRCDRDHEAVAEIEVRGPGEELVHGALP